MFRCNSFRKYVVGQTGVLHMLKDFIVENMYFVGVRMFEKPIERQDYLQPWEYVRDTSSYAATADVKKPKRNTVYKIANADMIYYNDSWAQFTDEGDGTGIAKVDVEGHINFIGDVIREEY